MFTQHSRHRLLQRMFWNPIGARVTMFIARFGRMFDTVVRGYSLIGHSNGERWITGLADPKGVMFDVGFYSGDTTGDFLEEHPQATVHAFDPSSFGRGNYERRFGDDPRVQFTCAAVSSEVGELDFYDYENMCNSLAARKEMPGAVATVYKVPVTTLDAYCAEADVQHVNFLKIDAEGYDLDVLLGARELLSEQKVDIFMFEFASGWTATHRYLWEPVEFIDPLPYKLFRLFNGFLVPLVYSVEMDSCTTRPCMVVGVSEKRLAVGDIPQRNYRF